MDIGAQPVARAERPAAPLRSPLGTRAASRRGARSALSLGVKSRDCTLRRKGENVNLLRLRFLTLSEDM